MSAPSSPAVQHWAREIVAEEADGRGLDLARANEALPAVWELLRWPRAQWWSPRSQWEQLVHALAVAARRLSSRGVLPRAALLAVVAAAEEIAAGKAPSISWNEGRRAAS